MSWSKKMNWSIYYNIPHELQPIYLDRLELKKKEPSKKYLDELTRTHQIKIPFENLDATDFLRPISIEPQNLINKILKNKRGGYCFELNGLFFLLLLSLGFDAWMCPCRQLRHPEPYPVPATHCGILVYCENKTLFCDVGYGGPAPQESLEFKIGEQQYIDKEIFCFYRSGIVPNDTRSRPQDSGWYTLVRKTDKKYDIEMPLMQMTPLQCYLSDFHGQNMLRSLGDTAYSVRHVSRNTKYGYIDITGNKLTINESGIKDIMEFKDSDLKNLLLKYFNIDIA